MLLVVWIMSYVEKFLKKYMPEVIKVFAVPFLTVLIMTPLALCVLGPLGSFLGNYVCKGIIALYNVAGPVAVMILGATFGLLVCTGMHQLLFVYLYTSFPMLGYDGFLLPGVFASSWVGLGIAVAAMIKFKKKENKTMVASYLVTWLFGGVGEPMLYGFQLRYRTALYASIISGAITGLIEGFLGLKAYVLNPSNGIYSLTAFIGGPKSNYVALGISLVIAIAAGFVMMMILPLKDEAE
jgi:PTS system beta-glucosides-specific IIC component